MNDGKTTYYDSSAAAQSLTEANRIYMEMNHRTKETIFYHYDPASALPTKYKSFELVGGANPYLNIDDSVGATTINFDLTKLANTIGSVNFPNLPTSGSGGVAGDLYRDDSGYLRVVLP